MKIVTNKKIIKAIEKKYNLKFDYIYNYCISQNADTSKKYYINNKEYILKFVDGCFYPYLIKSNRKYAYFIDIPIYCNFYKTKKGYIYYLSKKISDYKKDELQEKYFNIEFFKIEPLFAAELKKDAILLLNKKFYK